MRDFGSLPIDLVTAFGHYAPGPALGRLIRIGQRTANPFGQQLAQLVRRWVLVTRDLPLDIVVDGLRLRCYLTDNYSEKKFAFMPWRFDARERDYIRAQLPRGGVFVDIGANVGIYTLTAALAAGAAGRVLAFEPNPPALARLKFNLRATAGSNPDMASVDVLPVGVSDQRGSFDLYLHADNLGGSTLRVAAASAQQAHVVIPCKPLLDCLTDARVDRIDVLKIDIEGAEDKALMPFFASAPREVWPRHVIIENSWADWEVNVLEHMCSVGYRRVFSSRMNTVLQRQ